MPIADLVGQEYKPKTFWDQLSETNLAKVAMSFYQALKLPGDVYQGRVSMYGDDGRTNPQVIGRATDLAGLVMGGAMPMAKKGAVGIFGGRLAATADQAALKRAEDMASAGASRESIWNETGWFKGADDKWRFEIADNKSRLGPRAVEELTANGTYGATQRTSAGVLQHQDLYAAYPHLRGIDVDGRFNAGLKQPSGVYHANPQGNGGRPQIGFSANNLDGAKSTMLHEMQHAVQQAEGFAPGGGLGPVSKGTPAWEIYQRELKAAPILDQKTFSLVSGRNVSAGEYKAYVKAAEKSHEVAAKKRASELAYFRKSGEVEARNVEKRRDMTSAQRQQSPPWETEDVAFANQILR